MPSIQVRKVAGPCSCTKGADKTRKEDQNKLICEIELRGSQIEYILSDANTARVAGWMGKGQGYGLRLEVDICHLDVLQKARVQDVSCRIGDAKLGAPKQKAIMGFG